jgi:hypothetical protein
MAFEFFLSFFLSFFLIFSFCAVPNVKKSSTNITLLSNPIVYSLSINLTTISDFIVFFNTLCVSIPGRRRKGLFAVRFWLD